MSNTTKYVTPPSVQLHASIHKIETDAVIHQNGDSKPWICTHVHFKDEEGKTMFSVTLFGADEQPEVELVSNPIRKAVY